MVYRLSFVPDDSQPFSIITLMDWLQVSEYKSDLPDFLVNTLDSIFLRSFTLGWFGSNNEGTKQPSFSPIPGIVEIDANLDSMAIIPETFELSNLTLTFRIDNPRNSVERTVFISARGTVDLADSLIEAHFTMGRNPFTQVMDPTAVGDSGIALELNCQKTPLKLGNVLRHFLPNVDVLPEPFQTLANDVGLGKLLLTMDKGTTTAGKWALSLLVIELSLEDVDFDICGKVASWLESTS